MQSHVKLRWTVEDDTPSGMTPAYRYHDSSPGHSPLPSPARSLVTFDPLFNRLDTICAYLTPSDLRIIRSMCKRTRQLASDRLALRYVNLTLSLPDPPKEEYMMVPGNHHNLSSTTLARDFGAVNTVRLALPWTCHALPFALLIPRYIQSLYIRLIPPSDDKGPASNPPHDMLPIVTLDLRRISILRTLAVFSFPRYSYCPAPIRLLIDSASAQANHLRFHRLRLHGGFNFYAFQDVIINRCTVMNPSSPLDDEALPLKITSLVCHNVDAPLVHLDLSQVESLKHLRLYQSKLKSFSSPSGLSSLHVGPDPDESYGLMASRCNERELVSRVDSILSSDSHRSLDELRLFMLNAPEWTLDLRSLHHLRHLEIHECAFADVITPPDANLRSLSIQGFYIPPWGPGSDLMDIRSLWYTGRQLKTLKLRFLTGRAARIDLSSQPSLENIEITACRFTNVIFPIEGCSIVSIQGCGGGLWGPNTSVSALERIWKSPRLEKMVLIDIRDRTFDRCRLNHLRNKVQLENCVLNSILEAPNPIDGGGSPVRN